MAAKKWWINRNAILLSLSAFFADMGYQAILAGFPVFLVFVLKAPAYLLGITYAISYGGGAVFGYIGGRLGDALGKRKAAIAGNIFILLMPLTGFAASAMQSIALFTTGWWSRNFRSPPRRAMLSDAASKGERGRAFGMLHAFDVGGGAIAVLYLLILLHLKFGIGTIFILTAIPIAISTLCLLPVTVGRKKAPAAPVVKGKAEIQESARANRRTLKGVLLATALFGFSFYSLGFPVLTIAQEAHSSPLGILSYLIYLAVSAAAGYIIGINARRIGMIRGLSILGYMLAAFASLLIGLAYALGMGIAVSYIAVALMGVALGSIETFEPTIISFISSRREMSKKMGYLTSSRSIGLFIANAGMGILYALSPFYSYLYAFVVSLAAAVILMRMGGEFKA